MAIKYFNGAMPESAIVGGATTPRYDINGLIIGYNTPSSRYAGGAQQGQADFPTYGPDGTIVGYYSRTPYTGKYGNLNFKNGRQTQLDPVTGQYMTQEEMDQRNAKIQNDPSERYKAVNVDKNPDIESATSDLVKQFKDTAASSLKDFGDYLDNFKADVASARTAGKAATDIGPTVTNLRNYQGQYNNSLDDANAQYQNALTTGQNREQQIVNQAQSKLGDYDKAAQDVADAETEALQASLSKYKLGTGTPTSLGSDEQKLLAAGVENIQLPTQLAKIQRQYDVFGNYALPVARESAAQNIGYAGSFLPSIAGARYGANTSIENSIQGLKMTVANMSFDDATRYMQSLGIPWQLQSQILSGNVQNLGGLNALESGSRYQGLQDILGANITRPQGYSFSASAPPVYGGGYPNVSRYGTGGDSSTSSLSWPANPYQGRPGPQAPPIDTANMNPELMGFMMNPMGTLFPSHSNSPSGLASTDYFDTPAPISEPGSYFA